LRTFIAIELDDSVRKALARTVNTLAALDDAVKPVAQENLHLTVKFLGETAEALVADVLGALEGVAGNLAPFELDVAGLGAFPGTSRPRVIWAGCKGPPGVLEKLARDVDRCTRFPGTKNEKRPFAAHVTLGRLRRRNGHDASALTRAVNDARSSSWGSTEVNGLSFFMSELSRSGPRYTLLGRAQFGLAG